MRLASIGLSFVFWNMKLVSASFVFRDDRSPLAVVARLEAVIFEANPPIRPKRILWSAHNTGALATAAAISEGIIRPSASDPKDEEWLPSNLF